MSSTRRKFLRNISLGAGALATGMEAAAAVAQPLETLPAGFNMCGYAAPKLDVVRIGIVGLGQRGSGAVERLSYIDGVEITALCDKYPDRVEAAQKTLQKHNRPKAKAYSGEEGYKALCESNEVDLVYTPTPWHMHAPIALYAMRNGKHAAVEVPAAVTMDECWELVETSEKTKKHCMMLENCCYDFFEMLTLNMARNGLFGDIVHAEGAYIHDLSDGWLFNKKAYADMWRLKENAKRNGSLYPTHGLGPIAQCMDINRGDRMDFLVSVSSADFTLAKMAEEKAAKDPFFSEFTGKKYRGNMNTTTVKTVKGRTMMIQHDVSTRTHRFRPLMGQTGTTQRTVC